MPSCSLYDHNGRETDLNSTLVQLPLLADIVENPPPAVATGDGLK